MTIYSENIIRFISRLKKIIEAVLTEEVGVKVSGSRFFDPSGRVSYPISVVVYNNKRRLAYFDAEFYELGFHERLLRAPETQLVDVVRHELAHFMTFILHGNTPSHGREFRAFCEKTGWGENVSSATMSLEEADPLPDNDSSALRKVRKLLALTGSGNRHEAEAAMMKSREILLKHKIDESALTEDAEEPIVLKRILRQKKETPKMRSIAKILETFFVNTIYRRSSEAIYLEISGTEVNVQIAEYVADVLNLELEKLWLEARGENPYLQGATAKNSFFLGVAAGYCERVGATKKGGTAEASKALVALEKQLITAKEWIYSRLKQRKTGGGHCPASSRLGREKGKNLLLPSGITGSAPALSYNQ